MNTIPVNVQRVEVDKENRTGDLEADLERVRAISKWLDARFQLMGVSFGFDSLIGLVPVVGDTVTSLIATYPIVLAQRHGLGKLVQAKMAANVLIDWAVGLVPAAGDLFDLAYKANLKNFKLFEQAAESKRLREIR